MSYFYEKRPQFCAVQFDGTTQSVVDMKAHQIFFSEFVIRSGEFENPTLEFTRKGEAVKMQQWEWVVLSAMFDQAPVFSVMSNRDFKHRYEPVTTGAH